MILYGAGGHAKVVYDCLISQGKSLVDVFDDDPSKLFNDKIVINPYRSEIHRSEELVISIGSNQARSELSKKIGHDYGMAIHKTAFISNLSELGLGVMVMANAIVQVGASIGNHTIINTGAIVEHDSIIKNFAHVGPGSVICGDVKIGRGALIGANATILPGVEIGEWAIVGAGSVVLKDVKGGSVVAGNPAKNIHN